MSARAGLLLWRAGAWPLHLLLAGLVLPRAVLLGEALFERDLHLDWYPRAVVLATTLRQGLPPLWDLSIGFGQPLLGDPSAQALYPTTWLLLLLSPPVVYTLFAVLHLAFSGAGMTRLARAAGLRPAAAALAGVAWMLGGPFLSTVNLWQHFAGAAWLPWVVLAGHRLVRRPSARSAAAFGAALGLQVLAGSLDMVLLGAGACVVWAGALGLLPRPGRLRRTAGATAAGLLLALLLSAGQWLPALELVGGGVRSALPADQALQWSVPPWGLIRVVLPLDSSGRLAWGAGVGKALFDAERPPLLASLYAGVVVLGLALAALAPGARWPRRALVLVAAALAALLVAMGPYAPLHAIVVEALPGARLVRYPSKVSVLASFALALLAGLGAAAVARAPRARRLAGAALVGLALVVLAGAVAQGPALGTTVRAGLLASRRGVESDALPQALRFGAGGLLSLATGLALLRSRSRLAGVPGPLLLVAVAGDLLLAHHDLHATTPAAMLRVVPPVLSAVDRGGHARTYVYEYRIIVGTSERLLGRGTPYLVAQSPSGEDPRPLAALAQRVYPVPPVGGSWALEGSYDLDLRGLQPLPLWGLNFSLRQAEGTAAHLRLLRIGAVRTVISLHRSGLEDLEPGPTFASLFPERILTFRVPGALPRARVVPRARALEGREALVALFDPAFDPASEVVLSGPSAAQAAMAARGAGEARITELRGDRVRVAARLEAPGILVLADAWDPGWRAWVDDRPTEVLRANVAFRAVALPAGEHVVELRYRPTAVLVGLTLSACGLLALAAAATAGRKGWIERRRWRLAA